MGKWIHVAILVGALGCGGEEASPPAPPAPTSDATDEAFGQWAVSQIEPMRHEAIASPHHQAMNEDIRTSVEGSAMRGVFLHLQYYGVNERGFPTVGSDTHFTVQMLVTPDGNVRYAGFGTSSEPDPQPWPDAVQGSGLAALDEYIRFTIQHRDCAFETASAEQWQAAGGLPMDYDEQRVTQMTTTQCAGYQELVAAGVRPHRTFMLSAKLEGSGVLASNYLVTASGAELQPR